MYIESAKLTFYIPHATSLKDKRKVRRSIIDKARHRFNASISEVATQDTTQTLTIGISLVSGNANHAEESLNEIIRFMQEHTEAELIGVED